jgi:hypothetical protein
VVAVDDAPLCVTSTLVIDTVASTARLTRMKKPDAPAHCSYVDKRFDTEIVDGALGPPQASRWPDKIKRHADMQASR